MNFRFWSDNALFCQKKRKVKKAVCMFIDRFFFSVAIKSIVLIAIPIQFPEFQLSLNWCSKQNAELHFDLECEAVKLT